MPNASHFFPALFALLLAGQSAPDLSRVIRDGDHAFMTDNRINPAMFEWATNDQLRKLRNMIFAKHGHRFKSADLATYFGQFSWYTPSGGGYDLNSVEKTNVALIRSIEDERKKGRFRDLSNGALFDNETGIWWTRCAGGKEYRDGACAGEAADEGWGYELCRGQKGLAGRDKWRAPTVEELQHLVSSARARREYGEAFDTADGNFWTNAGGSGCGARSCSGGAAYVSMPGGKQKQMTWSDDDPRPARGSSRPTTFVRCVSNPYNEKG